MKNRIIILLTVITILSISIFNACELFEPPLRDNTFDPSYEGDAVVPDAPSSIELSASLSSIIVKWEASDNAEDYTIFWSDSSDFDQSALVEAGQTANYNTDNGDGTYTYTIESDLIYGTEYNVWVVGVSSTDVLSSDIATGTVTCSAKGELSSDFNSGAVYSYVQGTDSQFSDVVQKDDRYYLGLGIAYASPVGGIYSIRTDGTSVQQKIVDYVGSYPSYEIIKTSSDIDLIDINYNQYVSYIDLGDDAEHITADFLVVSGSVFHQGESVFLCGDNGTSVIKLYNYNLGTMTADDVFLVDPLTHFGTSGVSADAYDIVKQGDMVYVLGYHGAFAGPPVVDAKSIVIRLDTDLSIKQIAELSAEWPVAVPEMQIAADNSDRLIIAAPELVGRFDSLMNVDTSFGSNGTSSTFFDSGFIPSDIAVQADDKIYICGYYVDSITIACLYRINSDGSLDQSFANNGRFFRENSDFISVSIGDDGKVLLAGVENGFAALWVLE